MDAFLGYAAVTAVTYAPADNPTRMVCVRARLHAPGAAAGPDLAARAPWRRV